MQGELALKLLQYFSRKNLHKGFTLVELLVVIIIIGILTAIALPSFINQTVKARQSEAKNTIGTFNSAQSAFRVVNSSFATAFSELSLGIPDDTVNYNYKVDSPTPDFAQITAQAKDSGLKGYSGAIEKYADSRGQLIISSTICEAATPGTSLPSVPSSGGPPDCTTVGMKPLGR